ncbi:hypothetical protein TNCV_912881 [Trichonephila clavipes]|nr:hypothetical protein TNCV_912881 [Trichonephila clavipes]
MKPSNCDVDLPSLHTGEKRRTDGRPIALTWFAPLSMMTRRIVHMTVMDRAATSRTVKAHHSLLRIIRCLLVTYSTPFVEGWNVCKTSIASFTFDWKPQAFASPMVR